MKIKSIEFMGNASDPSHFPPPILPEIAFLGRSNVGKSSLINTLLLRKKITPVSSTPGKTRSINFYKINNKFYFSDLPGYGYAKVSLSLQKKWKELIEGYLVERKNIVLAVCIFDCRRPLEEDDMDLLEWLDYHKVNWQSILTKTDRISRNKPAVFGQSFARKFPSHPDSLIYFSSVTRLGRDKLWGRIRTAIS